jgi:hypothetical protein
MTDTFHPPARPGFLPHADPALDGTERGDSWRTVARKVNDKLAATEAAQLADQRSVAIILTPSETENGMDILIQMVDGAGAPVEAVHAIEVWMSEDEDGIGLTNQAYSGDLTAEAGAILEEKVAKKHWTILTGADGAFLGTLVDTDNPDDQYVAALQPDGSVAVSAASGDNWGEAPE